MNPLITINILTYNRKEELRVTLNKVINQQYKNIEIIVVDNASTDSTSEMMVLEFPSVRYIRLDKNIGISGWNEGFKNANGDYILVLDDDSYPEDNALKDGIVWFSKNKKLGILAYNIHNSRTHASETECLFKQSGTFTGCGALISRELIGRIGYFNERIFLYLHELDFSIRCREAGYEILYDDSLIVIHNQSLSARDKKKEDPFRSEYRYYYYFLGYATILLQHFSLASILKYFPKLIINKLIIALAYGYLRTFFKGFFKIAGKIPSDIKNRKPVRKLVQSSYQNGNIALIDRDFFPGFTRQKLDYSVKNSLSLGIFYILKLLFSTKGRTKKSEKPGLIFFNLGGIGDQVIASVIFSNESELLSSYRVYYCFNEENRNYFADYNGNIELISVDRHRYRKNILYRLKTITGLRKISYYYSVNISVNHRMLQHELTLFCGAAFKVNLDLEPWFYLEIINSYIKKQYNAIENIPGVFFYKIAAFLEKYCSLKPQKRLSCYIGEHSMIEADRLLTTNPLYNEKKKIISFGIFASVRVKEWDIDRFCEIMKMYAKSYNIVLLGSADDSSRITEEISRQYGIINLCGNSTIVQSAAIIKRSDLYIGLDSGLTHIAAALNTPSIALIGGGAQNIYYPYLLTNNTKYLYYNMSCFGCGWFCTKETNFCIRKISETDVTRTIAEMLIQQGNG